MVNVAQKPIGCVAWGTPMLTVSVRLLKGVKATPQTLALTLVETRARTRALLKRRLGLEAAFGFRVLCLWTASSTRPPVPCAPVRVNGGHHLCTGSGKLRPLGQAQASEAAQSGLGVEEPAGLPGPHPDLPHVPSAYNAAKPSWPYWKLPFIYLGSSGV
jgi:hypothetical protein